MIFSLSFRSGRGAAKIPVRQENIIFRTGLREFSQIFHGYDFMAGQGYPAGSGRLEPDLVSVPFANPCAQVTKPVACGKFLAFAGGTL